MPIRRDSKGRFASGGGTVARPGGKTKTTGRSGGSGTTSKQRSRAAKVARSRHDAADHNTKNRRSSEGVFMRPGQSEIKTPLSKVGVKPVKGLAVQPGERDIVGIKHMARKRGVKPGGSLTSRTGAGPGMRGMKRKVSQALPGESSMKGYKKRRSTAVAVMKRKFS